MGPYTDEELSERLKRRLETKRRVIENGCIEWTGTIDPCGYGRTTFGMAGVYVHRAAYALAHDLPQKFKGVVMHTCDNPACFNIDHLRLGTHAQNMADRNAKGRQAAGARCGTARLKAEEVLAIRAYKGPLKTIAAKYNVGLTTIGNIRARLTWKYLEASEPVDG